MYAGAYVAMSLIGSPDVDSDGNVDHYGAGPIEQVCVVSSQVCVCTCVHARVCVCTLMYETLVCVIVCVSVCKSVCALMYESLVCVCVCLQLPSNQSFYRQITGYVISVGDHRVG